jgi:hypothetical protein
MGSEHLRRTVPDAFGCSFADFENLVELKLLIVNQSDIGETSFLIEIYPRVDVRER